MLPVDGDDMNVYTNKEDDDDMSVCDDDDDDDDDACMMHMKVKVKEHVHQYAHHRHHHYNHHYHYTHIPSPCISFQYTALSIYPIPKLPSYFNLLPLQKAGEMMPLLPHSVWFLAVQ